MESIGTVNSIATLYGCLLIKHNLICYNFPTTSRRVLWFCVYWDGRSGFSNGEYSAGKLIRHYNECISIAVCNILDTFGQIQLQPSLVFTAPPVAGWKVLQFPLTVFFF